MLKSEYNFYLTDAQINAIHDVGLGLAELHFTGSGSVSGIVWDDYEVRTYSFFRDGRIAKESRSFDSSGWNYEMRNADGVWSSDLEVG